MSAANRARRVARWAALLAGDYQAIQRNRVPQRVANRAMGKVVGRAMRKVWF